jgi:hypothetical protein
MPIQRSKQDWSPGSVVKVGFMTLTVMAIIPTPGDWLPDKYQLLDTRNGRWYEFTPHNGLERIG